MARGAFHNRNPHSCAAACSLRTGPASPIRAKQASTGEGWLHEIKQDGVRSKAVPAPSGAVASRSAVYRAMRSNTFVKCLQKTLRRADARQLGGAQHRVVTAAKAEVASR